MVSVSGTCLLYKMKGPSLPSVNEVLTQKVDVPGIGLHCSAHPDLTNSLDSSASRVRRESRPSGLLRLGLELG